MKNLRTIPVPGLGPEDTLMDHKGYLYCSLRDDGKILRINLAGEDSTIIADTGGAPLGLEWLPDGQLLVCNADLGPQSVDIYTGAVTPLVSSIPFNLCNNAHVLADGTIFFSDSSQSYPVEQYQKDLVENTTSGRLIRRDLDGTATVLCDGLSFANGVVCIDDGNTVLVAETGIGRITKVSADGTSEGIFAQTPGHPDNMSIGPEGNIWVALPSLPSAPLAKLHRAPLFVRKIASGLPNALQPKPKLCCRVAVYSPTGKLLRLFDGDTRIYNFVTGVRAGEGIVALGSIEQSCVGIFEIDPPAA